MTNTARRRKTGRLNLPPVTPYQHEAFFCPERYSFIDATTKAGKTLGAVYWCLHEMGLGPNRIGFWVAPVYPQAEIAFARMKKALTDADPEQHTWEANISKLTITLRNGSRITFRSGDDPDNLYGDDAHFVVVDEASRCVEAVWHAVRSLVTATGGKVRVIGNVKGRRNWAYVLGQRAKSGEPDMRYTKITAVQAVEAGILPQSEIDDARRLLPDAVFRELYMAEPMDDGGNPFGAQHIVNCTRPMSSKPPVFFGIDLARKVDYTVCIGLDEDGNVSAFDRWHGGSWEGTIARIGACVGGVRGFADSTGVGDALIEPIRKVAPNVEPFQFTSKSKQQIMEGLAVSIQSGEVGFPAGPIVDELNAFEYVVGRNSVQYSAPEGMHDDCVCALALANQMARMPQISVGISVGVMGGKVQVERSIEEDYRLADNARAERLSAFMRGE